MIRVLMVCEREDPWQILATALAGQGWLDVTGVACSPLQAVAEAVKSPPDIAVVSSTLARGGALQLTGLLSERAPGCRVVIVEAEDDPQLLLASLEAGVRGFLTRNHGLNELLTAIRIVHSGEVALPRTLLPRLLPMLADPRREELHETLWRLTGQERRVLLLLVRGANNEALGRRLGISPQTARTHVQHVLRKLGVHSRLEAVAFVSRSGLLERLTRSVEEAGGPARVARAAH
jgi:DNA-binding NarL/FixJ family response regulator